MLDASHRHIGKMIDWNSIDTLMLELGEKHLVITSRLCFRIGVRKGSQRIEHKLTRKGLTFSLRK